MEFTFWKTVWSENQIGFHQSETNKNLKKYLPLLSNKKNKILVPLCGKSLDMIYLKENNFSIDGVEIVESAINEFFDENKMNPTVLDLQNGFKKFSSRDYSLYCGDFHQFHTLDKRYQAIYDRASMIALPPQMRKAHAESLSELTLPNGKILLITLEYDQEKVSGPPFSVKKDEVSTLFSKSFKIEELSFESTSNIGPKFKNAGIKKVVQRVYLLTKI